MGIRTPDLLHAISRQHVHRSTSAQVTVLTRAPESAVVHPGCGTSALYSLQDVGPDNRAARSGPSWPPTPTETYSAATAPSWMLSRKASGCTAGAGSARRSRRTAAVGAV